MTISVMGKNRVVLGLAICLLFSNFYEVSCQAEGSDDSNPSPDGPEVPGEQDGPDPSLDDPEVPGEQDGPNPSPDGPEVPGEQDKRPEPQDILRTSEITPIDKPNENENGSGSGSGSAGGSSVEIKSAMSSEGTSSSKFKSDASMKIQGGSSSDEYGAAGYQEGGQGSSIAEEFQRAAKEFANRQGGSEIGTDIAGQSQEADKNDETRTQLEQIERDLKAAAAQELVQQKFTTTTSETTSEAAFSMGSRQQYESKQSNGGSGIMGSLGIGQTGMWRCINQDQNGVKEEDDSPIVIPKYNLDDIIKEESTYEGSSSKTSSLIASLTAIVEKHKTLSSTVNIGKRTSTEKSEIIEKLRVTLKRYRSTKVSELVTRSDFEQILSMAARYEELTFASVSHISRLSMYKSMIKEGTKASQRVQLAQQRSTLLEEMANEKQNRVNAELELVKVYAQKGDALYVKIYALKKAILKLEAEKKEVEISFQKTVVNLSVVVEESSKAYEEHHVSVRKWKEEKTSLEFSYEAIEKAEGVWLSFLSTL